MISSHQNETSASGLVMVATTATLEEVDIAGALRTRPARPPDYAREHAALSVLVKELAENPRALLQKLAEVAVECCGAESAGVSLLDGDVFRWEGVAGLCASWRHGTMPREGPCGVCVERGAAQLMSFPIRRFPSMPPEPPLVEILLIPFTHRGKAVGTVWMAAHTLDRKFDAEDERLLGLLAQFASATWELWTALAESEDTNRERRRATELLERILDSLPAASVAVFDRGLRNRFAAGRGLSDMQWTRTAMRGRTVAELWGESTSQLVTSMFERAFAGEAVTFDMGRDGRMHQVTAAPFDGSGPSVESIVVVTHNISPRVRLETALRQSEHHLKALVDNTMAHVYVTDAENRLTMLNHHAASLAGAEPDALIGKAVGELLPPEFAAPIEANNMQVLNTGRAHQFEEHLPLRDGLHTYLSVKMPLFDDAGTPYAVFGISSDITSHVAVEERLQAVERRKDEFVATLLHEIRQPLAAATAALQLMKGRRNPLAAQKARAVIERQIAHLRTLADDLMESTRAVMGKVEMHPHRLDINTLAQDAVAAIAPLMQARHQHFTLLLPEKPTFLDGDPARLMQVVCNLLTNASKYTDDSGSISLRIAQHPGYVEVVVRDSGLGIAPDRLPYVFDPFVQLSDVDRGGLGIGLAVVRSLVQRHGGTIEARSSGVGQGSEFIVKLPSAGGGPGPSPDSVATRDE